jgi:dynein heavy chain
MVKYYSLPKRVKERLRVVLSMSTAGSQLRDRCRSHPAIVNCTTVNWIDDWSESAMEKVSLAFMEYMDLK